MSLCGLGINQAQSVPCQHGKFTLIECCFLCSMDAQIEALHKKIIEMDERLKNVEIVVTDKLCKKPHKCPVCDGCGNSKGVLEPNPNYDFSMKYALCNSCGGKGIVWG